MARVPRDPGSPLRTRLFIPAADASSIQWIESQENVSVSLRTVIHEVIERCGYGDVFNRQVEQQPRRGRPPGDANGQSLPAQLSSPLGDGADSSMQVPVAQVAPDSALEPTRVSEPIASPVTSAPAPVPAPVAPSAAIEKPSAPASSARPASASVDGDSRVNDAIMDLLA